MKDNLVMVRTIAPKHIEQLPWIHDEGFNYSGMTNLGRYSGAMIYQDDHNNLHRVSITVVYLQICADLHQDGKGMPWKEANQTTRRLIAEVPQLFKDDGKPVVLCGADEMITDLKKENAKLASDRRDLLACMNDLFKRGYTPRERLEDFQVHPDIINAAKALVKMIESGKAQS